MHSLGIVQWDSTRRDHPGYPGRDEGYPGQVLSDQTSTDTDISLS